MRIHFSSDSGSFPDTSTYIRKDPAYAGPLRYCTRVNETSCAPAAYGATWYG